MPCFHDLDKEEEKEEMVNTFELFLRQNFFCQRAIGQDKIYKQVLLPEQNPTF